MLSVRAARRYRWRLAGGRLLVDGTGLRFRGNRVERWRGEPGWECAAEDVTRIAVWRRMWLVVETATGAETFRVLGAKAATARILDVLPVRDRDPEEETHARS